MPTPVISFRGFGAVGLMHDAPRETQPIEALHEALDVEMHPSFVQRVRPNLEIFSQASEVPQWLLFWPQSGEDSLWFYGTETKLWQLTNLGSHTDVSRIGAPYNVTLTARWGGGMIGGIPFANYGPGATPPQIWDFDTTRFKDLPNWPALTFCNTLRAFKNFLVAGNLRVDGTHYSQLIRWSSPAAPGVIPASWDIADASSLAGEVPLGETPGEVIDVAPWRDIAVVFKTDSVYGMQFTGGQDVFRFWLMHNNVGLLSKNAWVNLPVGQVFVSHGDIILHNGQTWESIVDRKNRQWFFDNLSATFFPNLVMVPDLQKNEVVIAFPSSVSLDGALDLALVWNWKENTFTKRRLPAASFLISSHRPLFDDSGVWDEVDEIWNTQDYFWNTQLDFQTQQSVIFATKDTRRFYLLGEGFDLTDGAPEGVIERWGLPISNQDQRERPALDLQRRVLIQSVYPQMQGDGPVTFYFGGQEMLEDPIDWQGPFTFTPGEDRKIDLLLNTRFLSFRLVGTSAWKFYGLDVRFTMGGTL